MIVGSFVDANGTMRLDARIDDVETGEILVETAAKIQDEQGQAPRHGGGTGGEDRDSADLPPLPRQVSRSGKPSDLPGGSHPDSTPGP